MRFFKIRRIVYLIALCGFVAASPLHAEEAAASADYLVGVDDIILIMVIQPDKLESELTVSPDGAITFPYIGKVLVKGLTLMQIQENIQTRLAEYMKYPVVTVSLRESRSRMFFVYGEVRLPGAYPIQQNMSVLRAVSMAGGFTPVAATNDVKILRSKADNTSNETLSADVSGVMQGKTENDLKIQAGDVITVSKRFF